MWQVPVPSYRPHVAYWADAPYQTIYRRTTTDGHHAYAWADMRDLAIPLNLREEAPELLTNEWHYMDTSGDLGEVILAWIREALPDGGVQ